MNISRKQIRRLIRATIVLVLLYLVYLAVDAIFSTDASAQTATVTLANPGLEGEYTPWPGENEVKLPDDWGRWWRDDTRRPEYLEGDVAHTGKALKVFSTYGEQDAGILQEVYGVTPGQWYKFSAWVHYRSTPDGNKMSALACINPWGDNRVTYRTTVCGQEILNERDEWLQVSVTAQAFTDKITVSTRGVAEYPYEYSDFFWDDASLEPVTIGGICPTPAPWTPVVPVPTGIPSDCASVAQIEALLRGMTWGVR